MGRDATLALAGLVAATAIGAWLFLLRSSPPEPLHRFERAYLGCAPLPTIVAVALPTVLGLAGHSRPATDLLTNTGMALSGLQVTAGVALVAARVRRGARLGPRLPAGIALAAVPLLLLGLVAVLWRAG